MPRMPHMLHATCSTLHLQLAKVLLVATMWQVQIKRIPRLSLSQMANSIRAHSVFLSLLHSLPPFPPRSATNDVRSSGRNVYAQLQLTVGCAAKQLNRQLLEQPHLIPFLSPPPALAPAAAAAASAALIKFIEHANWHLANGISIIYRCQPAPDVMPAGSQSRWRRR